MCEDELYSLVGNNSGLSLGGLGGVNEREYEADRFGSPIYLSLSRLQVHQTNTDGYQNSKRNKAKRTFFPSGKNNERRCRSGTR